jgi:pimeloyl-ACP methyl ester carboxylesterase
VRPDRLGVEDVEAFANGVGLRHALLERERVDGDHLDSPAEDAQPRKTWLEMLDRRQRDALCIRRAAGDRRPETLRQLRRDAHHEDRRNVGKVIRPLAEVRDRYRPFLLQRLATRARAPCARVRLLCVVLRAVDQHGREKGDVEVGR